MIKKNKFFALALVVITFFYACDEEDANPSFGNVLIVNEGGFGASNATISRYDPEQNIVAENVFQGGFVGDVQQSVALSNNTIYSVLNNDNNIRKIDLSTFESLGLIEDDSIQLPRYIAIEGNTAYLSNWGRYTANFSVENSKVLVIDLLTDEVTNIIPTAPGIGYIQVFGDKLLTTRNYFGSFNHLTIINRSTNTVEADIELPAGPAEIHSSANGAVWVTCTSGELVEIDLSSNTIKSSIQLSKLPYADTEVIGNDLYFYSTEDNSINKVNLVTQEMEQLFTTTSLQSISVFSADESREEFYIGDQLDFATQGDVYRYSSTGELVDEFVAGIIPSQIVYY